MKKKDKSEIPEIVDNSEFNESIEKVENIEKVEKKTSFFKSVVGKFHVFKKKNEVPSQEEPGCVENPDDSLTEEVTEIPEYISREPKETAVEEAVETTETVAEEATETVEAAAEEATETVEAAVEEATETVADGLSEEAAETVETVADEGADAPEKVKKENPVLKVLRKIGNWFKSIKWKSLGKTVVGALIKAGKAIWHGIIWLKDKIVALYRKIRGVENVAIVDEFTGVRKPRQLKRYTKIRWKLMGAFILPVLLIIFLGIVSYNMASETVINKCMLNVSSTMSATDKYFKLMVSSVKFKAANLQADTDVTNYYYNLYDRNVATDATTKKTYNSIYNSMGGYIKQTDYLEDYYILCNQGKPMFSYKKSEAEVRTATAEMFLPFWDTEEAKPFTVDKKDSYWALSHPFIDETMHGDPDSYCLTFMRMMKKRDGVIVFDLNKESIQQTLAGTNLGDGCYVGLVVDDTKEINISQYKEDGTLVSSDISNDVLFNADDIKDYVHNTELDGLTTEIEYQGETYLFYRSRLGDSEIILCALVPESNLASELTTIRLITLVFVLVGAAIALGTGLLISSGISKTLKKTCNNLAKVADGDLSQTFITARTDEIGQLTDTIDKTVLGIHSIVEDVTKFSEDVNVSSTRVAKTSHRLVSSMKVVSGSLEDVYAQVQSQAVDTDVSAEKMAVLSRRIDAINDNTRKIDATVDTTVDISEKGRRIIANLNEQNNITTENINQLVGDIDGVVKKAVGIAKITETINEIAEQTNLLSLNASIEAARAGEFGRGFSVVAEEIHKLADESIKAGEQINVIIADINESTANAVSSAKMTNKLVADQSRVLRETNSVFNQINECIDDMASQLELIMKQLGEMAGDKDAVNASISNIVAVAGRVSQATSNLRISIEDQVRMMEILADKTSGLSTQASELNKNMENFIL